MNGAMLVLNLQTITAHLYKCAVIVWRFESLVQCHRTDWSLRAFFVAGPSWWNGLSVELRDLSVGPETFAKHLKMHLFRVDFFSDEARTFEFVQHFVGCVYQVQ